MDEHETSDALPESAVEALRRGPAPPARLENMVVADWRRASGRGARRSWRRTMPWLAAAVAAILIFLLGMQVGTSRAERSAKSSAVVVAGDSPSSGPTVVLWY